MATVLKQTETTRLVKQPDGTDMEEREPVFVYVHCYNPACVSYHNLQVNLDFERKVPGIRQETSYTYVDRGGDMPGIENSHLVWHPQDDADASCPDCGNPVNISDNPSRKIQQYGVGPGTGLQGAERAAAVAANKVAEDMKVSDDKVAMLEKQLARQAKMLEKLLKDKGLDGDG